MADKLRRGKEPRHIRLYHSIMDTEAYRHLSGNAAKVLLSLVRNDNGQRNGAIAYSYRKAADDNGISPRTALRCLDELEDKGFIVCTQRGAFSRKVLHASLWRYTWAAWPEGKIGPTRDFEKWKPDGKSRVQVLSSSDAVFVKELETEHVAGAISTPDQNGKPVVSAKSSFARIAPLTSNQSEPSAGLETEQRKQANPENRADLASLRDRVSEHLDRAEPGEQTRLAKRLDIPGGTFSKFLSGKGLPQRHRDRLARVMTA